MRYILPFYVLQAAFLLSGCGSHVLMSKNGPDGTEVEIQSIDVITRKDAIGEYETTQITWRNSGTSPLGKARVNFRSYDMAGKVICDATGWSLVPPLTTVAPGNVQVINTGWTRVDAIGMPRSERTEILSIYDLEAETKTSQAINSVA